MLAPWVISHFRPHRIYTEAFGGAASVLLRKEPCYAEIYNDLDDEVVNYFRVLRDNGDVLRERLRLTPFARTEFLEAYEPTTDPIERARRTVIKSFMGFGSDGIKRRTGFRANARRSGTTPAHDWVNYAECLPELTNRLRGVIIENKAAVQVIRQHDGPTALHYVDPPYLHSTRVGIKDKAYRFEMTDSEHVDLLRVLRGVVGRVVLSGYPSKLYDGMCRGWKRVERSALADGARKRTEVLWIKPERRGRPS